MIAQELEAPSHTHPPIYIEEDVAVYPAAAPLFAIRK